jgi:hypothetical protein
MTNNENSDDAKKKSEEERTSLEVKNSKKNVTTESKTNGLTSVFICTPAQLLETFWGDMSKPFQMPLNITVPTISNAILKSLGPSQIILRGHNLNEMLADIQLQMQNYALELIQDKPKKTP